MPLNRLSNYSLFSVLDFFLPFILFILRKLVPVALAAYCWIYIYRVFNKPSWSWIVPIVIFWISFIVMGAIMQFLFDKYEKTFGDADSFRPKPLTEKYGVDYKRPSFEEFDLVAEDYYHFNRTTIKLDSSFFIIGTFLIVLFGSMYVTSQRNWKGLSIVLVIATILSIIIHKAITRINLFYQKKSPHFDKIQKYKEALRIYRKIGEENGDKYRI